MRRPQSRAGLWLGRGAGRSPSPWKPEEGVSPRSCPIPAHFWGCVMPWRAAAGRWRGSVVWLQPDPAVASEPQQVLQRREGPPAGSPCRFSASSATCALLGTHQGCCLSACPCGRSLQPFVRSERCGASGTGAGLAGRHRVLLPLFCWFLCFCDAWVKAVASALLLPAARSARHRLAPAPRCGRVLLCSAAARSAAARELRIVLGRARKKRWKTSVYNTSRFLGTARPPLPLPKAFVKL